MSFDRAYVEISNACNLQCKFCPEVEREKKIMSADLFEKVLTQAKPLVKEITLHLMGEPLAHPQFDQLIDTATRLEVPIQLTSNGTLIKKRAEKLLASPIFRQINFSVQSLFDNFPEDKALVHLAEVLEFIDVCLKERPELYLNLRLWNLTDEQEFEAQNPLLFAMLKEKYGFGLNGKVDVRFKKSVRVMGRLYLHFDSRFDWPHLSHPVVRDTGFCYALKNQFGVLADGTVVPCCLDKEAAINLGRFTGEPGQLLEILNSPRAQNLTKGFERGEAREELCQRCTFIDRFDRKKTFLQIPSEQLRNS